MAKRESSILGLISTIPHRCFVEVFPGGVALAAQRRPREVINGPPQALAAPADRLDGVIFTDEAPAACLASWDAAGTLFLIDPPPEERDREDLPTLATLAGLAGAVILCGHGDADLAGWESHPIQKSGPKRDRLAMVKRPSRPSVVMESVLRGRPLDALGRGRGEGRRGGVRSVAIRRKRKNGTIWTTTQTRLEWEERGHKKSRYIRQALVCQVRSDWEGGATAKEIVKKYNLKP